MERAQFQWDIMRGDTFHLIIPVLVQYKGVISKLDMSRLQIKCVAYENANRTGKSFEVPIWIRTEDPTELEVLFTPEETLTYDDGKIAGNFKYYTDIQLTDVGVTVAGKTFNDVLTVGVGGIIIIDDITP